MKLELYFSEEEMREYLAEHGWTSIKVDAYEQYSKHYSGTGHYITRQVEVFYEVHSGFDAQNYNNREDTDLVEFTLSRVFLQEIKYQLLKL